MIINCPWVTILFASFSGGGKENRHSKGGIKHKSSIYSACAHIDGISGLKSKI